MKRTVVNSVAVRYLRCHLAVCWLAVSAWAQAPPAAEASQARPLRVGWAVADITPARPVALIGQLYKRISTGVRDPLTATVLALETQGGDKPEQAILVSCDLLFIQRAIQQRLQEKIRAQLPGFDRAKLFLNATHSHTAPGLVDSTFKELYDVSQDAGVMKASETDSVQPIEFHVLRLGEVAMATCPFELYLDYAIRIQARSPAVPTLLVQLACGASGYLPTARAVRGGGYSADRFRVGPEGGQVLVEETLRQIDALFAAGASPAESAGPECTVDVSRPGALVAPICRGQQLEEFNHQFEGGLYAQLINNPSFEELKNPVAGWSLVKPGTSNGNLAGQTSAETALLNHRQTHCAKLEVTSVASGSVGLANEGYWGIALSNHTAYRVSFWAKKGPHFTGTLKATLESNGGAVYAQSPEFEPAATWQHFTCDLTTRGISGVSGANRLVIYASATGEVSFDVVTLMPPTWKNRPNGLRIDLAEKLAALKPKYLQFPGGCTAESAGMDICWNWKNSIGPIEERPGSTRNNWGYKNDLYFGLDEYLQLCEDLGAEPVYVCSSGISENADNKAWFGI
ncbi:MAG TPA: hypothetical protein VN829_13125, partial [Dongiaceae bacterium]|nr:hypothetical protein [Dongiaceae bacterium]